MSKLEVKNLCVSVEDKKILEEISFEIKSGEVVVLMGPNGAGKSSIGKALMGHPSYKIISGEIILDDKNITISKTEDRAKSGLFMTFQDPIAINGVTMSNFLRTSYNLLKEKNIQTSDFFKLLDEKMSVLGMDKKFRSRYLNFGFSGGEKKKSEILQLLLFEPKFAILDEIDSGLDVDALKLVGSAISKAHDENKTGFLVITHLNKILEYIKPDRVLVIKKGRIVEVGNLDVAKRIEEKGFE